MLIIIRKVILQAFTSRNVEPSNSNEPPAAVMKNQKGNKEFGKLLGLEQGKGRYDVLCLTMFLPEMSIPDWVADTLKG